MEKKIINTNKAPGAIGPYVQAVSVGDTMYCSGQLGLIPETGELAQGVKEQAHQAMKNVGNILAENGLDYSNIVKATIFVKDLANFGAINEVYGSYFTGSFPARSCVQVAALPKDAEVEVEVIAVR
ncbi:MAG: RidA family protein [Oscillospiraceae bacterium]